ncbi:MAG: SelT/SelW/SelH family protein [Gemmataceae bacterium]|nr:SelT/SelW/SelH family protein [Gemmataceae bacterium]
MAGAIQKAHGDKVTVNQKTGSGGVFDVEIDGKMVFRKWDENRFPDNKEILKAIAGQLK